MNFILCCGEAYDAYALCHLPQRHKGPHRAAGWPRKKDGTVDRRFRYNLDPDIEWEAPRG